MFAIIVNFTWAWVLRVWAIEFEEFKRRRFALASTVQFRCPDKRLTRTDR